MRTFKSDAFTVSVSLTALDCASCGIVFGITKELESRRREDHQGFSCPNGHTNVFTAETETEKALRAQKELTNRLSKRLDYAQDAVDREAAERKRAEESLRATKGHVTRLRKKMDAGLCPYPDCRRHFNNLHRHIAEVHNGESFDAPEEVTE